MDIRENIIELIKKALGVLGVVDAKITLEHPENFEHGDYSTSVALAYAKELKMKPHDVAEKIVAELNKALPEHIERIDIAGPGFINFHLTRQFFVDSLKQIISAGNMYGKNYSQKGKSVLVEYTDANAFKELHIGHLMSNTIGEALSRIIEANGADVKRACYSGDIGLHAAKAVWGMMYFQKQSDFPIETDILSIKARFLGKAYAYGATEYEENEHAKKEIIAINKHIYAKDDKEIIKLYTTGRTWSYAYLETIYKKLGTNFDYFFYESETTPVGLKIVEEGLEKGVFEKSDGAVVFKGEKYGLHTRVFINSEGLPTYEAKDLGLNKKKFETAPFDQSIIITANEQTEYFKVMLKALSLIYPEMAEKTTHIAHGFLRLPTGKMSSRTGQVVTGESLIVEAETEIEKKIVERGFSGSEKEEIVRLVGAAAIKYTILKQAPGRDVIFDMEKSLSTEGDSGPYLQYAHTRALSVLEKAKTENITGNTQGVPEAVSSIEQYLYRFPEVVERAMADKAPQLIATYLIELAASFNGYYATNKIVDITDATSPYKVALTHAFRIVMKNGLWMLGIGVPSKM
ncbi:MAG: arginine--tRNA ligase [Candidatus Paceibacterota bacterium]|jgi:arginyl-tRNA synthetase